MLIGQYSIQAMVQYTIKQLWYKTHQLLWYISPQHIQLTKISGKMVLYYFGLSYITA